MSAPRNPSGQPEITHQRAILGLARDKAEARNRIEGNRASIAQAIKEVWRAYADGEIDDGEAERRDRRLREEYPRPPQPARPVGMPLPPRPRRRPDWTARRQHVRKLAFSGPMPPRLACPFTTSELAVLNIVADEVVKKGTCRLTIGELAARAQTCPRTTQTAIRKARESGLLVVRRRRLSPTMSLPNIIIIVSSEWLVWLKRRGAWEPSPRVQNKGAKWCRPQVQENKKERDSQAERPKEVWRERREGENSPPEGRIGQNGSHSVG